MDKKKGSHSLINNIIFVSLSVDSHTFPINYAIYFKLSSILGAKSSNFVSTVQKPLQRCLPKYPCICLWRSRRKQPYDLTPFL
jgi:hypothetical protein